jgi:ribosomal protein L35AE/L33A
VLDEIEATLEGRASKAQASITINGRAITYMRPDELLSLRTSYRREVAREKGESMVVRAQFGSA